MKIVNTENRNILKRFDMILYNNKLTTPPMNERNISRNILSGNVMSSGAEKSGRKLKMPPGLFRLKEYRYSRKNEKKNIRQKIFLNFSRENGLFFEIK